MWDFPSLLQTGKEEVFNGFSSESCGLSAKYAFEGRRYSFLFNIFSAFCYHKFISSLEGFPEAAGYSIHFPMQHCSENVLRILQFVISECEALPSSAKAPYVLTVELLQQEFSCQVQLRR